MVLESDGEAAHTPSQSVGRHGDLPHTHTKLVRRPLTHTKVCRSVGMCTHMERATRAWGSASHTHLVSPLVGMGTHNMERARA